MVELGRMNQLRIVKFVDFGLYLDGGDGLEILLPLRYIPCDCQEDDMLNVFIYHDSEGRLIATTIHPLAVVGEVACLEVKSVSNMGAFMEWGIMKDLLVPFREQKIKMVEGRRYLVYPYIDSVTGRIVATAKIHRYLDQVYPDYTYNQEVTIMIADETELGYKVIINNLHYGLVYHSEVFTPLYKGDIIKGYVKYIREQDQKIDISLTPLGYDKVEPLTDTILMKLQESGGHLNIHDKSDPEAIYEMFHCSKKSFKQAVGALYKNRQISIEPTGIALL